MKLNKIDWLVFAVGICLATMLLFGWTSWRHTAGVDAGNPTARYRSSKVPLDAVPVLLATLGANNMDYRVTASGNGFRATNPRQSLEASFDGRGVTLRNGRGELTVRLSGYGYGDELEKGSETAPRGEGNRVEYQRGLLNEWYVNGPYGFEQGFTLTASPGKRRNGLLQIALNISGDMVPTVERDGKAVSFAKSDGKPMLRCTGLLARDADGRALSAKMELRSESLFIEVDDSLAHYPIVVDPTYAQTTILTAGASGSRLGGEAVGIDNANDTIVATAPGDGATIAGSAYVFVKQGTQWTEATQLVNSDHAAVSVAISGDGKTIVVGSCGLANCVGHVFLYSIPNTSKGWSESGQMPATVTLAASDGKQGDRIGLSVTTDYLGDTVAFGAPCDFTAGLDLCGSVYVFVQPSNGAWVSSNQETAKLTFNLPSGSVANSLGFSVAMDGAGDTIVAGTPGVEGAGANQGSGAAYVFVRPSNNIGSWATTSTANATLDEFSSPFGSPPNGDFFGSSVAIDFHGDAIAVGAPHSPNNCSPQPCLAHAPGMAYVFLKPTSTGGWNDAPKPKAQDATLIEMNSLASDQLGSSVAMSEDGSTVVAGAASGAYVFNQPSGGWGNSAPHEDQKLSATNGTDISGNLVGPNASGFGSVALSSDASTIAGTSPGAAVGSNQFQGAVFLFTPDVCALLTPTSYDFGAVPEYTSTNFTFTLSNVCSTPLASIGASISGPDAGDFEMSSAHGIPCTGSLAPNASCNFNVVFTPLGNDSPELATLSVSDLDGSSPQRASLTGTATASNALFTITPIAANPAGSGCPPATPDSASCTATVKSGQVATYTFQLTSVNGFNSPVPLKVSTALSNLPSNAGPMTFSSTSVVPSATGTTVTMTVGTQLSSQAQFAAGELLQAGIWQLSLPALGVWLLLGWKRLSRPRWLSAVAFYLILMGIGGCDGSCSSGLGKTSPTIPSPTLASGTYTITVEADYAGVFFGGNNPPPPQPANLLSKVTLVVQ